MAISQKPIITRTCKKRKEGSFLFVLFAFSVFQFMTLESGSASVKRWNTETPTNGKNECEYEIIYWKKHSWSLWIWKWSSQLQLVFVVWGHPTHKALSHAPIARQRAYIPSYFLLLSTRYKFWIGSQDGDLHVLVCAATFHSFLSWSIRFWSRILISHQTYMCWT